MCKVLNQTVYLTIDISYYSLLDLLVIYFSIFKGIRNCFSNHVWVIKV